MPLTVVRIVAGGVHISGCPVRPGAVTDGRVLPRRTSHDSTRYYVSLPANKLELWFAVEAERFQAGLPRPHSLPKP